MSHTSMSKHRRVRHAMLQDVITEITALKLSENEAGVFLVF